MIVNRWTWLRCCEMFPYRLRVGLSCISSQLHPWSSVLWQDNLPVCFCHHHAGVGHYSSHVHVWVLLHSTHLLQDCSSNTQVDTKDKYFLWCDKWRTHCWWCVSLIFVHASIWTEFTFLKGLAGLKPFPNFDSSDTSFFSCCWELDDPPIWSFFLLQPYLKCRNLPYVPWYFFFCLQLFWTILTCICPKCVTKKCFLYWKGRCVCASWKYKTSNTPWLR